MRPAKRFGFTGALVPGVEVYAYMCHMPVARWGRAFLEKGAAECRFFKPVYAGNTATTTASVAEPKHMTIRVDSAGDRSAEGWAAALHDDVAPSIDAYAAASPPHDRPPASFDSLLQHRTLGIAPVTIDDDALAIYLRDISEDDPLYRDERLVHPGQILRLCNAALVQNVVLGPWIHVGSGVRNFAAARLGDELTLRARVTSNVETKGHAIVTFDAIAIANGTTVVARVEHVAIWRPRQVATAA